MAQTDYDDQRLDEDIHKDPARFEKEFGKRAKSRYTDDALGDLKRREDEATARQVSDAQSSIPNKDLRADTNDHDSSYQRSQKQIASAQAAMPNEDLRAVVKVKGQGSQKKKNKLLTGGLIFGGLGAGAVVIILIGLLGALLIPQLAEHIAAYQFTRVTRQFAENQMRVTDEKLATDAIPESEGSVEDALVADGVIDASDEASTSGVSALINKLNLYRPSKVIANLQSTNGFKLNYSEPSITGRQVLQSVELGGESYPIEAQGLSRFIPVVGNLIKFKNDVNFAQDFAPALEDSLRANDVGMIIRGSVAKDIRQELGISLIAWYVGKYSSTESPQQARLTEEEQKVDDIDKAGQPDNAAASNIKEADEDATEAEASALTDPAQIEAAINNGGVLASVKSSVSNALAATPLSTVVGVLNPVYKIAMPVCIIYDGSLDKSAPTIDNQTDQEQRAFYYVESAASQEKAGATNGEAVGATNDDLNGDDQIQTSVPEQRSSGETPNTLAVPSAEASADGEFTLLNATPGIPGGVADTINAIGNKFCPTLTNIYGATGLALANLVLAFFSGGGSEATEDAAGTAATDVIDDAAGTEATNGLLSQLSSLISKTGVFTRRASNLVFDTAKSAATISAFTLLAKIIVMSRASQMNSGFAQGIDLADEADAGGNVAANNISQVSTFGRPMTLSETTQNTQVDRSYQLAQLNKESTYQRVFAISNPDSLASKLGLDLYGALNPRDISTTLADIIPDVIHLFNPFNLVAKIFDSFGSSAVLATSPSDINDYGNVQFGWSTDEEHLIDSDNSYLPIENQKILDDNQAAVVSIANEYAPCFGYKADPTTGDLTMDPTDQVGDLLSNGDITRDSNGNVELTTGKCAPCNLTYNGNPECPNGNDPGNLVFRWRLANSYNNTLDQLGVEGNLTS